MMEMLAAVAWFYLVSNSAAGIINGPVGPLSQSVCAKLKDAAEAAYQAKYACVRVEVPEEIK